MAMMQTHVTTLLTTYTTLQGTFASADRVLEMLAPIPSNPDSPFAIAAVADEIWGHTTGFRMRDPAANSLPADNSSQRLAISSGSTVITLWASSTPSVFLDCFFNAGSGLGQILRIHDRPKTELGVEREKPWFRDGRDLRGVLHVEDDRATALAVIVGVEIGRLRFEVGNQSFDSRGQGSSPGGCVPGLHRNGNSQQHTHDSSPSRARVRLRLPRREQGV